MRRQRGLRGGTAVAVTLALAGCGGSSRTATPRATGVASQPVASPTAEEAQATAPTLRGNAATNPACKLLSVEQVSAAAGLSVNGLLGLPADKSNPAKLAESCTWYLESKSVQSSLVLQYTVYARRPADLLAYYPQVIAQGYGKAVPHLGDISKISGHVLDTIYKRAEIHVSLLVHAEATAQDQAAAVSLMRVVMAGVAQ